VSTPLPTFPIPPGAASHLAAADPVLAHIIERVGDISLELQPDLWWALVDAIAGQQLSVAAAATIVGRLDALGPPGSHPSPGALLTTSDEQLRACGLSRAKVSYVKDLASRWEQGLIQPDRLTTMPDEEVIERLVQVKGIGRWTAEMALIFCFGRPDVLPVDDLGLKAAVQAAYALGERPGGEQLRQMGQVWSPFRTAASLYLWRSRR